MTTLLDLRNGVLVNLNDLQDSATGSGDRYKIPNLNYAINRSIKHYTNLLNTNYQGYLNTNFSLNVLANVSEYDLGATFRSPIYEVRRTVQNVNYYLNPIHTYNAILFNQSVDNNQWIPSYHLEGTKIIFSYPPLSDEVGAVIIKYQKKLDDLVLDLDPLDDQLYDAEDCIVMRATLRALKAKDVSGALKNVTGWEKELADGEKIFMQQVGNRYVKPDKPIPVSYDYDTMYV